MRRVLAAVFGLGVFAGAVTAEPAEEGRPPFPLAAFRKTLGHGPGQVIGRLAVDVGGRGTLVQGGVVVTLLPAGGYTDWWMHAADASISAQRGRIADPTLDPHLAPFRRIASTDRSGYFTFDDLPPGKYVARGRLSVSFARTSVTKKSIPVGTVDGNRIVQPTVEKKTVTDYTYVFLATDTIRVTRGPAQGVRFHVTARRNVLADG